MNKQVPTNDVTFTFPGICSSCEQERYDNGAIEIPTEQELTICDLQESGWPLCSVCDAELEVSDECTVTFK